MQKFMSKHRSTYAYTGTLSCMSHVPEQNAHLHVSFTLYTVGHTCMYILSALLTLLGLQQVPNVPLTTFYFPLISMHTVPSPADGVTSFRWQ